MTEKISLAAKKVYKDSTMRKLVLLLGIVFVISGISAAYLLIYERDITAAIVGETSALSIVMELDNIVLNVSESLSHTEDLILDNGNGELLMMYYINSTFNGSDGSCLSDGDVDFVFKTNGTIIAPDSQFTMYPNQNVYELEMIAISERVCPGVWDLTITLQE